MKKKGSAGKKSDSGITFPFSGSLYEIIAGLKHRNLPDFVLTKTGEISVSGIGEIHLLASLQPPLKKNHLLSIAFQLACLIDFLTEAEIDVSEASAQDFGVDGNGVLFLANVSVLAERFGYSFFDGFIKIIRLLATGKELSPGEGIRERNPVLPAGLCDLLDQENISSSAFIERLIPFMPPTLLKENIGSLCGFVNNLHKKEKELFTRFLQHSEDDLHTVLVFTGAFGSGKSHLMESFRNIAILSGRKPALLKASSSLSLPLSGAKRFLQDADIPVPVKMSANESMDSLRINMKTKISEVLQNTADPVLLIDDIHLLDRQSLEMFSTLCRDLAINFAATASDDFVSDIPELQTVGLGKTSRKEMEEAFSFSVPLNPGFLKTIWSSSGGNPFVYGEFLDSFLKSDECLHILDSSDRFAIPFPSSLEEHYRSVFNGTENNDRLLIKLSSVLLNEEIDASFLGELTGENDIHGRMDHLCLKGIFHKQRDRYFFKHALFKEFIYKNLSEEEKKELHHEVAGILPETNASAVELFHHWYICGESGNAIRAGKKAVTELKEAFDYKNALSAVRKLKSIAEEADLDELLFQEAELLFLIGSYDECIAGCLEIESKKHSSQSDEARFLLAESMKETGRYRESLAVLSKLPEDLRNGVRAKNLEGLDYWLLGDIDEAFRIFNDTLKLLGRKKDINYGITVGNLGVCLHYTGNFAEAEENLVQSVRILKKHGQMNKYTLNLSRLARLYKIIGKTEASKKLYRRTLQLYSDTGDISGVFDEMLSLGCIYRESGDFKKAESVFREIIRSSGDRKDLVSVELAGFNLAVTCIETGNLEYSENVFLSHLARDRKAGEMRSVGIDLFYLGVLLTVREELSEAAKHFAEALGIFRKLNNSEWESLVLVHSAKLGLLSSDPERAEKDIKCALGIMKNTKTKIHLDHAEIVNAEILFRKGKYSECKKAIFPFLNHGNSQLKALAMKIDAMMHFRECNCREGTELVLKALRTAEYPPLITEVLLNCLSVEKSILKNTDIRHFTAVSISFCRKNHIRNKLSVLEKITGKTGSYGDPALILKKVRSALNKSWNDCLESITQITEASGSAAVEFDPFGNVRVLSSFGNMDCMESILSEIIVRFTEKPEPVFLTSNNDEFEAAAGGASIYGVNSFMACPVFRNRHLSGLVYTDRRRPMDEFTDNEYSALLMVCELLSAYLSEIPADKPIDTTPDAVSRWGMIGGSPPMKEVFDMISKAAPLDIPVLISGNTGTGKELAAKAIHDLSRRNNKPFVAINCAAVPENLLESELFGYRKGAFSGADKDRQGLLESANGGTFFMDEIGEMPLLLQAKLLRVIQEKCLRRLGSSQETDIDVRIISATHRNLKSLINEKLFREDLYYRLNVLEISLPDLKDRRGDIRLLAQAFFNRYSEEMNRESTVITPQVMSILLSHDWPGNIRELENTVRSILARAGTEKTITEKHLPGNLRKISGPVPENKGTGTLGDLVSRYETAIIDEMIAKCGGNKTEAARKLGITRQTLLNKLKK